MITLLAGALTGIYWVFGQPIHYNSTAADTVIQLFVCERDNLRQSEVYQAWGCLVIGPPAYDMASCYGEQAEMAKADFPGHKVFFCVPVRRSDLERLSISR